MHLKIIFPGKLYCFQSEGNITFCVIYQLFEKKAKILKLNNLFLDLKLFKNLYDKANNAMCCACEIVKYCCPKNIEKDSTNSSLESTYMTGYWHLDDDFAYV